MGGGAPGASRAGGARAEGTRGPQGCSRFPRATAAGMAWGSWWQYRELAAAPGKKYFAILICCRLDLAHHELNIELGTGSFCA